MSAAIATGFRAATHAVRRCAELRGATRPIRAAARSMQVTKCTGARFPASVLGADLVALFGKQLQDRLSTAPASSEEAAYRSEAVRVFSPAETAPARRPLLTAASPANAPRAAEPAPPSPDSGEIAFPAIPEKSAGAREPAPATTFLEKKLREYWRMEQSTRAVHTASSSAARSTPKRPGSDPLPMPANATDATPRFEPSTAAKQLAAFVSGQPAPAPVSMDSPSRPAEPAAARTLAPVQAIRPVQSTFAERLQSFVSGRGEPREHAPAPPWRAAEEPGFAAPRFATESAPARTGPAGEFAGRLAETLYAQAIQHGIDLT